MPDNKKLFTEDKNESYTEYGIELDKEIYQAIYPIFKKWVKCGFKIREIEYIISKSSIDISLNHLLGWD